MIYLNRCVIINDESRRAPTDPNSANAYSKQKKETRGNSYKRSHKSNNNIQRGHIHHEREEYAKTAACALSVFRITAAVRVVAANPFFAPRVQYSGRPRDLHSPRLDSCTRELVDIISLLGCFYFLLRVTRWNYTLSLSLWQVGHVFEDLRERPFISAADNVGNNIVFASVFIHKADYFQSTQELLFRHINSERCAHGCDTQDRDAGYK